MTDKQTPPAGYSKLPDGERCRCIKLWQGSDGFYCCKPRASEMTDKQTHPDWVLNIAADRSELLGVSMGELRGLSDVNDMFRALCDMIQKYEQPPVDRKLLCAEEAYRDCVEATPPVTIAIRAIELWEKGFGK